MTSEQFKELNKKYYAIDIMNASKLTNNNYEDTKEVLEMHYKSNGLSASYELIKLKRRIERLEKEVLE